MPLLALLIALAQPAAGAEEGFKPLFNGKDLTGFKFFFDKKDHDPAMTFWARDGVLGCTGAPVGYLYTEKSFKDFTLRFDWRYVRPDGLADEAGFEGNSGYLLWVTEHKLWPRSLEVQGMNRDAGGILPIPRSVKVEFKTDAEARLKARKPVGEWNSMEIDARGGKVLVRLNGALISTVSQHEYQDAGAIAFQSEGAPIQWRNIRIKE
jgi:hypothetical protein